MPAPHERALSGFQVDDDHDEIDDDDDEEEEGDE